MYRGVGKVLLSDVLLNRKNDLGLFFVAPPSGTQQQSCSIMGHFHLLRLLPGLLMRTPLQTRILKIQILPTLPPMNI